MHPIIEEIGRARGPIRNDVFRRWQRVLRDEVQPLLDERDRLLADQTPKAEAKRKAVTA